MNNLALLYAYNPSTIEKPSIGRAGEFVYKNKSAELSLKDIHNIIRFFNSVNCYYPHINVPVKIELGASNFTDKLTYIILECLCYNEITNHNRDVRFSIQLPKRGPLIQSHGQWSSPLMLLSSQHITKRREYTHKFAFDIFNTHFRRILRNNEKVVESLGFCLSDIANFLGFFNVDEDSVFSIAEVITELMGNAIEHANSDVLVDIDVAKSYLRDSVPYYGVNVVVLNFASETIGHDLKIKMSQLKMEEGTLTKRYLELLAAYKNHEPFFNSSYDEDSFYLLASFQDKISGRIDNNATGGTGLTTLITSLEERAENHLCFMISGDKMMFFPKECLETDSNNWIRFCRGGSFLTTPPDEIVLYKSPLVFPGVAYNLTFVMKERE